ncbi:hypothetical protein CDD83_7742 [Cordyceps sp. RAO-2017]|nr:hypothetical protein CDD83_7742 [Cordyceps sp. RAO-2017]
MADHSCPIIDHIVVLVPHATLEALPDRLRDSFVVAPGGRHADGLTANKLILFQDGAYIELIAFVDGVDPGRRRRHRWGQLRESSVVDWAYTLPHERDFAAVQQRLTQADTGIVYSDPVAGGRTRPDGTVLEWAVAMARGADGEALPPGRMPFWCLDRTRRDLRVPYAQEPRLARHPCGARGVSAVALTAPRGVVGPLGRAYDAIHGASFGGGPWRFRVSSDLGCGGGGRHEASLAARDGAEPEELQLSLHGDAAADVELVPGLTVRIEPSSG